MRVGFGAQVGHIDVAVFGSATGTTLKPAMTALAGFVPWAEVGIRQTLRCASPRDCVIVADREQAGVFALRAGVRLQRDGGETR